MITVIFSVIFLCLILKWFMSGEKGDVESIPGPDGSPWWRLFGKDSDRSKIHLTLFGMKEKYGPIFRIRRLYGKSTIFATDYDSIYKVLITSGKEFGGRPTTFRQMCVSGYTGILFSAKPDQTWKSLRKNSQRHLKQFGDGLTRLESIIGEVADDMFTTFQDKSEKPFDPKKVIFDTSLLSIAFLITGERFKSDDPLIENMREYEALIMKILVTSSNMSLQILDALPWVRHLGNSSWKLFTRFYELEASIWKAISSMEKSSGNLYQVLFDHINSGESNLTEMDVKKTMMSLLLAGVTTTSGTFYAAVNILAHNSDVQNKIYDEICAMENKHGRRLNITDRLNMPYTRAVIHELLRYVTVVPNGVAHRTCTNVKINGYEIPADYTFITGLWSMHHDETFWGDPFEFRPERFLDDEGEMIPADHPNRKHLIPFGAGLRVCLGESLALTRLFLWTSSMVQRFKISPAKGNMKWTTDARLYQFDGVMRPLGYHVVFEAKY